MNIVLAGRHEWEPEELAAFSENGANHIHLIPDEEQALPIPPGDVGAIVCNWFFKYHDLREFTGLKYIQLLSAGYNGIDTDLARSMGIELHNAKDVYNIPISEFVIGGILAFYKKTDFFFMNRMQQKWEKNRSLRELYDQKVLIVGTGSIGNEIAKRLKGFTQHVFGCNRTVRETPLFSHIYPLQQLPDAVQDADIVILSVALTGETEHLINSSILQRMKKDVLIVNVSRGRVIDEAALVSFLAANQESGAVLDVFEEEPLPPESPLWKMQNVFISPHNSFVSNRNSRRLSGVIVNNYRCRKSKE